MQFSVLTLLAFSSALALSQDIPENQFSILPITPSSSVPTVTGTMSIPTVTVSSSSGTETETETETDTNTVPTETNDTMTTVPTGTSTESAPTSGGAEEPTGDPTTTESGDLAPTAGPAALGLGLGVGGAIVAALM